MHLQDEDFFISLHFVSLRWEYVIFHKGWVLQTLDVLRVCYNHTYVAVYFYTSPYCGINIYNILAWASRCCSNLLGNATASVRGTTTVGIHVFFVPKCTTKPSPYPTASFKQPVPKKTAIHFICTFLITT